MLNRSPRAKPTRVMPNSSAMATARLDGAPTAITKGMPATAAFCRISKLLRPLTARTVPVRAVRAELHVGPEDRAHDVVLLSDAGIRAIFDSRDVPLVGHDSLGEQESRGQFEIVAGRAHRHRQGGRLPLPLRAALHANLHRLLGRELVRLLTRVVTAHLPHRGGRR